MFSSLSTRFQTLQHTHTRTNQDKLPRVRSDLTVSSYHQLGLIRRSLVRYLKSSSSKSFFCPGRGHQLRRSEQGRTNINLEHYVKNEAHRWLS